jgi:hypothetical protein
VGSGPHHVGRDQDQAAEGTGDARLEVDRIACGMATSHHREHVGPRLLAEMRDKVLQELPIQRGAVVELRPRNIAEARPVDSDGTPFHERVGKGLKLLAGRYRAHGRQHEQWLACAATGAFLPDPKARSLPCPFEHGRLLMHRLRFGYRRSGHDRLRHRLILFPLRLGHRPF